MKKNDLRRILEQRKKELVKHKKAYERELIELRKSEELSYDREILGAIQHPLGYCTGAICEIENTLRLLTMSYDDYSEEKRQSKKIQRKTAAHLKKILKKSIDKNK